MGYHHQSLGGNGFTAVVGHGHEATTHLAASTIDNHLPGTPYGVLNVADGFDPREPLQYRDCGTAIFALHSSDRVRSASCCRPVPIHTDGLTITFRALSATILVGFDHGWFHAAWKASY